MRNPKQFELNRQLFHVLLGVVIVILLIYGFIGINLDIFGLTIHYAEIFFLIIFGFVISYLSKRMEIPVIRQLLMKFERERELKEFPGKGMLFYLSGVYIALLLFPKDIAMASILVLAMGDSVSHIFGLHYGRISHPLSDKKFLEGTIMGFAAAFVGAFAILPWPEALAASAAAMVIEAIEIKIGTDQVDDNLIIPVVAGAAVWLLRLI